MIKKFENDKEGAGIRVRIYRRSLFTSSKHHSSSQDNICSHEVSCASRYIHTSARASTICRARIEIKIAMKAFCKYLVVECLSDKFLASVKLHMQDM